MMFYAYATCLVTNLHFKYGKTTVRNLFVQANALFSRIIFVCVKSVLDKSFAQEGVVMLEDLSS